MESPTSRIAMGSVQTAEDEWENRKAVRDGEAPLYTCEGSLSCIDALPPLTSTRSEDTMFSCLVHESTKHPPPPCENNSKIPKSPNNTCCSDKVAYFQRAK